MRLRQISLHVVIVHLSYHLTFYTLDTESVVKQTLTSWYTAFVEEAGTYDIPLIAQLL
jgi:hypothetical protein